MKRFFFSVMFLPVVVLVSFYGCSGKENEKHKTDTSFKYLPAKLPSHPRLFFPKGQEKEILKAARTNDLLRDLIETLRIEADSVVLLEPQKFTAEGDLLNVSREQIRRNLILGMAYRLFGNKRYAEKAVEELMNVCSFRSWSPSHFLDDAEMTTAVAIGYDWCYGYLTREQRKKVERAIDEKAFGPARPIYIRKGMTPFNRENNWNMVCNSGMVTGALAIADVFPSTADSIIGYAVKYTPKLLGSFSPQGVFNEGPMYWSYNGMYMALFFDNLKRLAGNDFRLTSIDGIRNTARYYIEQVGPSDKPFNYGDAGDGVDYNATFFLLSRLYGQAEVAEWYRSRLRYALDEFKSKGRFAFPRYFFLAIPWFDNSHAGKIDEEKMTVFPGITDLVIFNGGSRSDSNRLFLAAKTGRADWSHNQLDAGSFVVDCEGERWGIDIGSDSYSLPDFWDNKPDGKRWQYFRNTNKAHSTLSIDDKITWSTSKGIIVKHRKEGDKPFAIMDLTPYYPEAEYARRGFMLESPKSVLVSDEVRLRPGAREIKWRFVTKAAVEIIGNEALLRQNGKEFRITCLLRSGYEMKVVEAKPYSDKEKPIKGVNIVEITVRPGSKPVIIPVLLGTDEPSLPEEAKLSLSDWK